MIYDLDPAKVYRASAEFYKVFSVHDAQLYEEKYNLLNAFLAAVPGSHVFNLRHVYLLNTNDADLSAANAPTSSRVFVAQACATAVMNHSIEALRGRPMTQQDFGRPRNEAHPVLGPRSEDQIGTRRRHSELPGCLSSILSAQARHCVTPGSDASRTILLSYFCPAREAAPYGGTAIARAYAMSARISSGVRVWP